MGDTFQYEIGTQVRCDGEDCGKLAFVVVDPVADKLTHLVVQPDEADSAARLIPVHLAVPGPDGVDLNCTRARFEEFEAAVENYFLPGAEPARPTRGDRVLVVVSPDSEVTHVLLEEGHLWGRKRVAIPIRDVTGIDQDGVAVRLTKDEIKVLPPVDVTV